MPVAIVSTKADRLQAERLKAEVQARAAAYAQLAAKRDELLDKVFAGTPLTAAERADWAQLRAAARKP